MKKIIDWKMYDSETAEALVSENIYDSFYSRFIKIKPVDHIGFRHLMVTKSGNFFLYEDYNNQVCKRNAMIYAMTEEEVRRWLNRRTFTADVLEKIQERLAIQDA